MAANDGTLRGDSPTAEEQAHFRRTLIRVMTVQVVALIALWLLQSRYTF